MPISRPLRLAVLTAAAATAAACSEPPPPVPETEQLVLEAKLDEKPAPPEAATDHELLWLPDGSRLLVDAYWVFAPDRGTFVPLQCATPSGAPCKLMQSSFVADGTEYVIIDADSIAVGSLAGGLGPWEQIPRWLPQAQSGMSDEIANTGFWIAPGRVFVRQFYTDGHGEAQCRVRYTANGVVGDWRLLAGGCFGGEFSNLTRVDPGPTNLFALHSEAEGQFALSIVRYAQEGGLTEVRVAPVGIEGTSRVGVRFAPDGSRVEVISPCTLTGAKRDVCEDPLEQPLWKLYSLPIPGEKVELLRADLPPGTVADPVRDRFAWVKDNALCVGDPRISASRCEPLPVR